MRRQFDPEFDRLWERVAPYTMTSPERGFALWEAVHTIVDLGVPGAFVECGVWKGGSAMLIALALLQRDAANREIILFDTFTGMSHPTSYDRDFNDQRAQDLMAGSAGPEIAKLVKAEASLDSVRVALASTGYDMRLVRFVPGDVRTTLPHTQTLRISLLRLDTDFYDSTKAELEHLYPRLAYQGILIIDDYGHWQGARRAVEEYFCDDFHGYARPMLWALDYTGRGGVKSQNRENVEIQRYDYVPPGMTSPNLLPLFPNALPQNPWTVPWPFLRKQVPHVWRSDTRWQGHITGNASVEEVACLHALACQFRGKRGVEIGTHFGWTAAHLVAAGVYLDCIDPEFSDPVRQTAVRAVLEQIPNKTGYRLWAGSSPDIISTVREAATGPWSFAFIDGNHDGDAPRNDAHAVIPHMAADALAVLHDLTSPHVERGLAIFREAGFSTRLFNTMQILGIAWRGDVVIPEHIPDPNVPLIFASHLAPYVGRQDR